MQETGLKSIKIDFSHPFVESALDCATFIGLGILTHSCTTWINHPISAGGVAFAGFLNASILGLSNKLARTNQSEWVSYKIIITIAYLALGAFAAPYIVQPLATRFGVVLSGQAARQLAYLHFAIKGSSYVLLSFIPLKMPSNVNEVTNLDKSQLKKYFSYFTTEKGKQEWKNLKIDIQLTFLNKFNIELLLFSEGKYPLSWKDIKDQDLIDHHAMITRSLSNYSSLSTTEEKDYLYLKYFSLDMPPPYLYQTPLFSKMLLEKTPDEIKAFTPNQAKWAYSYFLAVKSLPPSEEIAGAYLLLFYNNDLKLTDDCTKYDQFSTFSLPFLQSIDEIQQLKRGQLEGYFQFTKNINNWKQFSLPLQHALNCRFQSEIRQTWNLFPNTIEEIKNASREIIENLHEGEHIPYHWLHFSEDIQINLNKRFSEFGLTTYPTFYQQPGKIMPLSRNSTPNYYFHSRKYKA